MGTRFVIFSAARSGTSYLTDCLRSHPEILCHGEALLPRHFAKHVYGSAREDLSQELCETDPVRFAHEILSRSDGHGAVGFKVFPAHSPSAHGALLRDEGVRKIILQRENSLASFSSLQVARITGRWNDSNAKHATPPKIEFVQDDFDRYRNRLEKYFLKVRKQSKGDVLDVTYEREILGGKDLSFIQKFLDVSDAFDMSSGKSKLLGSDIAGRFSDPDRVRDYLVSIGKEDWSREGSREGV